MNEKSLKKMTLIGEMIILATVVVFLCFLNDTGIRFIFNNGVNFVLYDAKKFFYLMAFVLAGSAIGSGFYFYSRQKINLIESQKFSEHQKRLYQGGQELSL